MASVNIVAGRNLNGYHFAVMLENRDVKPLALMYTTQQDSKMPDFSQ